MIRYYINKEKRTIVAIEDNFICEMNDIISKTFLISPWQYSHTFPTNQLPNIIKGVAKCSPEDTWNEEVGKKVALSKLINKRNNIVNKELDRICTAIAKRYSRQKSKYC